MDPADTRFTASYPHEIPRLSMNVKKLLLFAGSVLVLVILYIYVSSPMVVTVTGSGQVAVAATNATVSFTLSASDPSINGAVTSVAAKADQMQKYLVSQGVSENSIAQSQITEVPSALVSVGATGYQATISMAAKTSHVKDINSLIGNLYTNGALVVAQPVLSVENQNKLDQQAFDLALSDAKSQAAGIGNSNWKFIRKIIAISQVSSPTTSTSTTKADTLTAANDSTAATNGVFKIVKAVSVSYKMW